MNKEKILVKVSISSTVICASIVIWIKFDFVNIFYVFLPSAIISWGLIWLIRNHLWRMPVLKYLFGNYPNLNGEWTIGILPDGEREWHCVYTTIVQKWDIITLYSKGNRADSKSTLSRFSKESDCFKLEYMWVSMYKPPYKGAIDGVAIVRTFREDASELTGKYWTHSENRSTIGRQDFFRGTLTPQQIEARLKINDKEKYDLSEC